MAALPLNVKVDVWRNEPKGATESMKEFIGVMTDVFDHPSTRKNTNLQNREIKIGRNLIIFRGYKSNTKKDVPKLGNARLGIKKQIQVNIFEEATEFSSAKDIEVMKQAAGGSKLTINGYIANP